MNKEAIVFFWRKFFTDLLLGTFIRLFLYGVVGFTLGLTGQSLARRFNTESNSDSPDINWRKEFMGDSVKTELLAMQTAAVKQIGSIRQ